MRTLNLWNRINGKFLILLSANKSRCFNRAYLDVAGCVKYQELILGEGIYRVQALRKLSCYGCFHLVHSYVCFINSKAVIRMLRGKPSPPV